MTELMTGEKTRRKRRAAFGSPQRLSVCYLFESAECAGTAEQACFGPRPDCPRRRNLLVLALPSGVTRTRSSDLEKRTVTHSAISPSRTLNNTYIVYSQFFILHLILICSAAFGSV